MIQRRTENKENAVSPVVGVMLMLVVTIVIAAVVTIFATGVLGDVKTTPTAVIGSGDLTTVTFVKNASSNHPSYSDSLNSVDLWHKGGSDLYLSEIELQLQSFGNTQHYTKDKFTLSSSSDKFTSGDKLSVNVNGCGHAPGTPVTWTLIDLNSGNKIASGDFIVPAATQNVIVPSLTAVLTNPIKSGESVSLIFSVPSSFDGWVAKLSTETVGYTLNNGDPVDADTVSDGKATFDNIIIKANDGCKDGDGYCCLKVTAEKDTQTVTATYNVHVTSLTTQDSIVKDSGTMDVTFKVPSSFNGGTATLTADDYTLEGDTITDVEIRDGEVKFTSVRVTGGTGASCTLTATATKGDSPDTVTASCTVTVTEETQG